MTLYLQFKRMEESGEESRGWLLLRVTALFERADSAAEWWSFRESSPATHRTGMQDELAEPTAGRNNGYVDYLSLTTDRMMESPLCSDTSTKPVAMAREASHKTNATSPDRLGLDSAPHHLLSNVYSHHATWHHPYAISVTIIYEKSILCIVC